MAALMSGSGTNVQKILEHGERLAKEEGQPLYEVAVIFTDRWNSRATRIGRDHDLPVITRDLSGWLKKHGVQRRDLSRREEFDREAVELLRPFEAKVAVYGGYMSIASSTLVRAFIGINVHPADLSVKTPEGKRRFVGAHAVRDAIVAGETAICSSTHLVTEEVDMGPLFLISRPLAVEVPDNADLSDPKTAEEVEKKNQERLKEAGDWVIFPQTLEAIARGWFGRDENGNLYYKNNPAPDGLQL